MKALSRIESMPLFLAKTTFIFLLSFCTGSAWAQGDSHEHFPEDTLLALEGQDAVTKHDCFLFVVDMGQKGASRFFAKVQTSYTHNHNQPPPIEVAPHPTQANVLVGVGANGKDQIAIFLSQPGLDLRTVQSYNLKWWHHNHFDNFRCLNMKVHEH